MNQLEPVHPACLDEDKLLSQCQVQRTRKGGPGGSHRNKVETAVELLHQPTGVTAAASERRSQPENQRVALFRLRMNLALRERGHFLLHRVPSPLWQSRLKPAQRAIRVSPSHADFPAILAEALDVLKALQWDPSRAARLLGCSTSQFIKLLKSEPRAMVQVNNARAARGLHRLK